MNSQCKDRMTQEMLDVLEVLNDDYLKQEFLFCQAQYLKVSAAENINLPCTSASGLPVIHKARIEMNTIKYYWERRRDAVKEFLSKDWVEAQNVSSIKFKR